MRVTELNIYPLKSGRGIVLSQSDITAEGLPGDRRAAVRPTTPTDGVEIPASLHEAIQGLT